MTCSDIRDDEALQRSNELLQAVSRAQSQFIANALSTALFEETLVSVLKLTNSEYGFVAEVLYTPEGNPHLRTHAITDIGWDEESRALYERYAPTMEFYNLKTLFGAALTSGKTVNRQSPCDRSAQRWAAARPSADELVSWHPDLSWRRISRDDRPRQSARRL